MKLGTFQINSPLGPIQRLGAYVDGLIIDLNAATAAQLEVSGETGRASDVADALVPAEMVAFLAGGALAQSYAKVAIEFAYSSDSTIRGPKGEVLKYRLEDVDLLAPLPLPSSIRDTLSFEGHMINFERRTGKKTPKLWWEQPIYYKGNRRSVIGPNATVSWPAYTEKLDYELEFAAVIGKKGRDISAETAGDYIAGYTIFNDISARDIIPKEVSMNLGPAKGKDFDAGNVFGPWLVTADELDASNLDMEARINGDVWSKSNSSDMYHKFEDIIAYISRSETLYPGDIIGSGTVENGCGDEMERWIKPGDTVELEVEGIGILRNIIGEKEAQ